MRKPLILLLGTALIMTGCASTAQGTRTSAMTGGPEVTLRQSAPVGTTLAVIRFPAFVEEDAEADFAEAYAGAAIGGRGGSSDAVETQALANSMVLKSNYFAMSLYRELAARLPEHSVLLSPHRITLASDGSLTSVPMTQAESLPSVVAVDFTTYSYPDPEAMMGDKPLSFGDLITPLVTVRTDPRAAVGTEGILLASSPIIDSAAGQNYAQAITDATALQAGRIEAGVPELDLISHISAAPVQSPERSRLTQPRAGTVSAYPIEKIRLDGASVSNLDKDSGDILEYAFTDGFVNRVVDIINRADPVKASMFRRADAISDYDESLAALTLVGDDAPDYLARLRYAERLLEAEQKYLSVQSLRLYDGVINGEMGAQVRDILREEYRVLEERRKLARQQNTAVALGVLSAVVAGVAIANSSGGGDEDCSNAQSRREYQACLDRNARDRGPNIGEQIAINAAIQGAIFSATEAMRRNRLSDAVGSNYLQAMIPALNMQTEIQVDLIDSNETITAIRFEDLKAKLGELYAENQRSLDTVATRCAYSGPTGTGTWLGACEDGLANGSGVGVFRNNRGDLVEHYGYARDGRSDGPGYRIVRAPQGSYALEGNFAQGAANGVMRVERSGSVALRRYRQGQDMGEAPAGSVVASPFRLGDRSG
ncbi:hypothetical protein ACFFUB_13560 [Algimonas porphyrae]|nr:hypothetical protein [Algimonas porphyrae]